MKMIQDNNFISKIQQVTLPLKNGANWVILYHLYCFYCIYRPFQYETIHLSICINPKQYINHPVSIVYTWIKELTLILTERDDKFIKKS